jgi:hypothetical protein
VDTLSLNLPRMVRVRQRVEGPVVADVGGAVRVGLGALGLERRVLPGQTVAITAGSRGISGMAEALGAVATYLRSLGADPFVVPAMGSHGGATAEGQLRVLAGYGFTPDRLGCPIRPGMEVVDLGRSSGGLTLWQDARAAGADHIVVCNRVKPHTMFSGPVESGLAKMLMIGLGKDKGASLAHRAVMERGWPPVVADLLPALLARTSVLAGVALVERADDKTAVVAVLAPEAWEKEEPVLLDEARRLLPRLPFNRLDLLLLDQLGKDISGAGLDTNVVGRKDSTHPSSGAAPAVRHIAARNLSERSAGNAVGIGLVEFARSRLVRSMDVEATRINALTSGHLSAAMIPIHYESDAEILGAVLAMTGLRDPAETRIVWAHNTLRMENTICSESVAGDEAREGLEVLGNPFALQFDAEGNLPDDLSVLWNRE